MTSLSRTRPKPRVRALHLGLGNFFRAHQAWYTQHAGDGAEWGIAAFTGLTGPVAQILSDQDGLYTLDVRSPEGDEYEVIESLAAVHDADDHDAWLAYWADPAVAYVTLTGVRTEGTTYAVFSFTRKMGQALGGAVAGYGLAIAAFNSAAAKAGEKPSLETVHGIQLWTGGLVAGFTVIAIAIMVFYPLTDAKFKEIVAEIKARREVPAV